MGQLSSLFPTLVQVSHGEKGLPHCASLFNELTSEGIIAAMLVVSVRVSNGIPFVGSASATRARAAPARTRASLPSSAQSHLALLDVRFLGVGSNQQGPPALVAFKEHLLEREPILPGLAAP